MNIEQIMIEVQEEFQSSGLTDGLSGDFAREVAKRVIAIDRAAAAAQALLDIADWFSENSMTDDTWWFVEKLREKSEQYKNMHYAKVRGAHDDFEQ